MKRILIFLVALILPLKSLSAEVGVSGAIGTTSELRLPVKMENLIIEPFVSRFLRKSFQENIIDSEFEENGIGVGVWKLVDMKNKMRAQYGLQLGYLSKNQTGNNYAQKIDGYLIAPGFGLFYRVQDNFDVGVEVKYRYESLDGELEETNSWIQTQAVLRLFI